MLKPVHSIALLLALSASWGPAPAQDVYRCGQSYSNSPCPGGIVVATADPRSTAQRAHADAATRRDTSLAQALEKDRLKREAQAAPAVILAPDKSTALEVLAADRLVSRSKLKRPELFTAVAPKKPGAAAPKTRKKKTAIA